ncbi:hypothetical protein ACFPRL_29670 [Pseudoclavibacter helvolus]
MRPGLQGSPKRTFLVLIRPSGTDSGGQRRGGLSTTPGTRARASQCRPRISRASKTAASTGSSAPTEGAAQARA